MSEYSRFVAWQAGCRDTVGYGITASDTFYCGFRNYVEPFPCPNGLPTINTLPSESWVHRERVAKARRDAEEWSREIRVRESAGLIKPKQVEEDLKEIKAWLTSLFTHRSAIGSRESSQVEAS